MALPTVSEIEPAGLRAWPAIDTVADGSWVLRASGGYTRRSNSVQSLDVADDGDAPVRLERAARWFRERGLQAVFRVTPFTGPRTLAALAGWQAEGHSHIVGLDLGSLSFAPDDGVRLISLASAEWLDVQQRLQGYDDIKRQRLRQIVERIEGPACGLVISDGGEPVASALMAVADGIVITGNVITATTARRRGLGRRMMEGGLAWARSAGARAAAHAVEAANAPALALYGALGYRRLYDYHYRVLVP